MEQSPSLGQLNLLFFFFWKPKVHYRVHNSLLLVPTLSQMTQQLPNLLFLRSILILTSQLHLGLPSGLFHSLFPAKIAYAFLISPIRATCLRPSHSP
jgi:hypothetical protein